MMITVIHCVHASVEVMVVLSVTLDRAWLLGVNIPRTTLRNRPVAMRKVQGHARLPVTQKNHP